MKKFICIILCLTLIIGTMPTGILAVNGEDDDAASIASDLLNDPIFNESGTEQLNRIDNSLLFLLKTETERINLQKQMEVYSTLMSGIRNISSIVGLTNGVISLLKLTGVIENPEQKQTELLNSIYDSVLEIQNTVNQINAKSDKIQNTLNSEFSKMQYNFNLNRYDSYQRSWSDFFGQSGPVAKLNELYNDYQSQVNADLIAYTENWQNAGSGDVRSLYADEFTNFTCSGKNMTAPGSSLPKVPTKSDDGTVIAASLTLPAAYILPEAGNISADNVMDYLYVALTNGVSKALADKALVASSSGFYEEYDGMSADEQEQLKNKITDDLLNSILYEVSFEAANAKVGVGTFASKVKSAFDTYYKTMIGNNNVTSPLFAGYQRLALTHGFEGEIKEEASDISLYLSELSMFYGSFATFVTAMDTSMNGETKEGIAKEGRVAALLPLEYKDSFLTGKNNYCYPLGMNIEYRPVRVVSDITFVTEGMGKTGYKHTAGDWHLIDLTQDYPEYGTDEYKQQVTEKTDFLNSMCISAVDVSLLFLYYGKYNSENGSNNDFITYLKNNDAYAESSNGTSTENPDYYAAFDCSAKLITGAQTQRNINPKTGISIAQQDFVKYGDNGGINLKTRVDNLAYRVVNEKSFPNNFKIKTYDEFAADYFDASGIDTGKSGSTGLTARSHSADNLAARLTVLQGSTEPPYSLVVFCNTMESHKDIDVSKDTTKHVLTFTKDYGMLIASPAGEDENSKENELQGSIFGSGTAWIIYISLALIIAAVAAAVIITRKKKQA